MSFKSSKKRTKLEKILRQDHSDVYFDNERLNDELNNRIEFMQKEMLKHDIERTIEIGKLKKEIHEFKLFRAETRAETRVEARDPDSNVRPQTVAGNSYKRRKQVTTATRSQSAWGASAPKKTDPISGDNEEYDDVEEDYDDDEDDEEIKERKTAVNIRAPSAASSVSTLRNTKTLRRYKNVGANCFKENNRYPEEWYLRCLPASDAAIYNARKKTRGKSAPSHFNFLKQIRDKEEAEKRLLAFTTTKRYQNQDNGNNNGGKSGDNMNLICEGPVKPILLSRRRLKELADANKATDRAPSRNTVRKQQVDDLCKFERRRMEAKVRTFCCNIEERKQREIEELKEREEARKREIAEQQYLKSADLAAQTENDNEDDSKD